jgi:hypothetical protein
MPKTKTAKKTKRAKNGTFAGSYPIPVTPVTPPEAQPSARSAAPDAVTAPSSNINLLYDAYAAADADACECPDDCDCFLGVSFRVAASDKQHTTVQIWSRATTRWVDVIIPMHPAFTAQQRTAQIHAVIASTVQGAKPRASLFP